MRVRLREITASDFDPVAAVLSEELGYPSKYFLNLLNVLRVRDVQPQFPKYGYLLDSDGSVVGAIILIYSARDPSWTKVRCHVTSWCARPEYRPYATLLAFKATNRRDVSYINISARPTTRPIIEAQGFTRYSNGIFLSFPLFHVFDKRDAITITPFGLNPPGQFSPEDFSLISAHNDYGCICFWCSVDGRSFPFVFRSKKFKGIFPGLQLIYCSDVDNISLFARNFGLYFLRMGKLALAIDSNGSISGLAGKYFDGVEPRYFKGPKPAIGDLSFTQKALLDYERQTLRIRLKAMSRAFLSRMRAARAH